MPPQFDVPEGATPIEDASGLIPVWIFTYADLYAAEAENILVAYNKHLKRHKNPAKAWFIEEYIRNVHSDMFKSVWDWAGKYRDSGLSIGVPAAQIREEIKKLCEDVQYWDSKTNVSMTIIERASRIHHRLTKIHPFRNGNGRHARLIADIYFHSHKHPIPTWPIDISQETDARTPYLKAIRAADHGNYTPLIEYMEKHLPNKP